VGGEILRTLSQWCVRVSLLVEATVGPRRVMTGWVVVSGEGASNSVRNCRFLNVPKEKHETPDSEQADTSMTAIFN
jgi:hypothetical protein